MIVAMDKEYKQLRPLFPEDKLILQKSGIATVNAAIQTVEMIRQYKPDCIISSGCAGGNGDDINLQDVVASSELTYHDVYCGKAIDNSTVYGQVQGLPARYQADPYLLDPKQRLSIWRVPLSRRCVIYIRYRSSRSVSSATFPCATPTPQCTTTSGAPLPRTPSKSPRHSSKVSDTNNPHVSVGIIILAFLNRSFFALVVVEDDLAHTHGLRRYLYKLILLDIFEAFLK